MPSFKYERSFTSADSEYHQPPLSLLLLSLDPPLTRLVDKNGLLDKGHTSKLPYMAFSYVAFSCMAFFHGKNAIYIMYGLLLKEKITIQSQ